MRIVYAIDAVGQECAGGLRAGLRVVESLRARHEVVLLGVGPPASGLVQLPALKVPVLSRIVAHNQFTFARPDDVQIARALRQADVLHVQLPFWLGHRAMAMARERGVPVVVSHHVQPENFLYNVHLNFRWLARLLDRWLVRSFYQRADAVVCPTAFSQRELLGAGLHRPSLVISNGAPPLYRPGPRPAPGPRLTLLTVGRMAHEKRQGVIIEAVKRARHRDAFELVVAGRGPLLERLKAQAAPLGESARIGYLDDDELLRLYQRADLYLHASEVELEGLTVLEAERCGCPALIADAPTSAARELALDERWLFAPGDPDALARRLDELFEHRDELQAARADVLKRTARHDLSRTVDKLEWLYRRVVSHELRPVPPLALVAGAAR